MTHRTSPTHRGDNDLLTEVEVRFTAEGGGTRVDLEHRRLERMGAGAGKVREMVDSENGWGRLLQLYAALVGGMGS